MQKVGMKYCFMLMMLVSCLLQSCKPVPTGYQHNHAHLPEEQVPADDEPKILFMTFRIQQKDSNTVIEHQKSTITYGVLKSAPHNAEASDRVYVVQLDGNREDLSGYYLEHPLRKQVEYTNASNTLATKYVELAEAEFFIRMQLEQQTTFIRLDEMRGDRVIHSFMFNLK